MGKTTLVSILVATFLAGGLATNIDLLAEAAEGSVNSVWAKLAGRVTLLENQLGGNNVRTVVLNDDEEGNAAGWRPQRSEVFAFTIFDPNVTPESVIHAYTSSDITCTTTEGEGQFILRCIGLDGAWPDIGDSLHYSVIIPSS